MADKPFADMTLDELTVERAFWNERVEAAKAWGAGYIAAFTFRAACDKWIERKAKADE